MDSLPEPWMRGPITGVDPLLAPVLYTFQQAREDLRRWTEGLSAGQIWAEPYGFASVGFHMRHIAGSTGRLISYLQRKPLNAGQLAALQAEHDPAGAGRDELLALVDAAFDGAATVVRALDPATLRDSRGVGRQQLPTTVIGLLVHIAEHTQRHVGQASAQRNWQPCEPARHLQKPKWRALRLAHRTGQFPVPPPSFA